MTRQTCHMRYFVCKNVSEMFDGLLYIIWLIRHVTFQRENINRLQEMTIVILYLAFSTKSKNKNMYLNRFYQGVQMCPKLVKLVNLLLFQQQVQLPSHPSVVGDKLRINKVVLTPFQCLKNLILQKVDSYSVKI